MKVVVTKPFGKKVKGQILNLTDAMAKNLIAKGLVEDVNKPKPKRGRPKK